MKFVNHTDKDLIIYVGVENTQIPEIEIDLKVNQQVKVGDDDGRLYVITNS